MKPVLRQFLIALLLALSVPALAAPPSQQAADRPGKSIKKQKIKARKFKKSPKSARNTQPPKLPPFVQQSVVRDFIQQMHEKHGFEVQPLQAIFEHARPIPAVQKAIMPPRDPSIRSWYAYRSRFIEPRRLEGGERFWQAHAATLNRASAETGVPEEIIVAIIGIESIYGHHMGNFGTLAALATLAFDYPKINPATDTARAALFRQQLEELLLLAREEGRDPLTYRGSYAGALGLPQFLPGSIRQYGQDGDHDGHIRLETSPTDAIVSVANFLVRHGWRKGEPVVARAKVSGEAYSTLIDEGILPKRLPEELARFGVRPVDDKPYPALPAALIDLVTPQQDTEYALGFQNFYVITRYNRSSFYAMAVHDLAQELRAQHQSPAAETKE